MEFPSASSLLLILLPPVLYISYHIARSLAKKKPTTHGLRRHPLLGHLPAFLKNRDRFLEWSTELIVASPDLRMGFWIPGMTTGIVTGNPADVEHILRANYPKGERAISMLADFLGHGLFNSDGEHRFLDPVAASWKVKKWLNVGKERRLKKAIADVHGFAMEIVRSRRQSASGEESRDDVLSRFVASDEHGDEALRDIALSFLIAGRETTSSALTWFFWLVSSRPDVVARIADEVRSVRAYARGRLAAIWGKDGAEFKPERWLGDDGAFRPESPFRYTVFHAGPRTCFGKEMAYVQMKSIAASVLEEFAVDVVRKNAGSGVPEHVLSVTLRMKGGLPVQIRRRVEA
uniref:Cytochrome P450 94A1 n=1 Tax=Aegilops tauschii TaxID=37682 RepID=M8C488_AEGTA